MSDHVRAGVSPAALCLAVGVALCAVPQAFAQESRSPTESRRAAITRQIQELEAQLAALDATTPDPAAPPPTGTATRREGSSTVVSELLVTGVSLDATSRPQGQTVAAITAADFEHTPANHIGDVLALVPGVTFAMGNGPRDVSISVRGSNARQTFGIRNLQVFEDGFPVTQPDGLARTDLTDPHAYGVIDVVQGPSSALYGNYATGGAIQFHLRPGRELNGLEAAVDAGSDGYANAFLMGGLLGERAEASGFVSYVRGDGFREHTGYRTVTENMLATYAVTDSDRLTLKVINNDTDADLSIRLSLAQYRLNPYQQNCRALTAAGCASVSLFVNGINGTRQSVSAQAADLQRNDRRTIVGLRWDHDLPGGWLSRAQVVWDNRDIKQPTSATSAVGTFPSFNVMWGVTRNGPLMGRSALVYLGAFYNTENINSGSYNVSASGTATPGALTQLVTGTHVNYGVRARAEVDVTGRLNVAAGVGMERTNLRALQTAYGYPVGGNPTIALISADRTYTNVAPELSATFHAFDALTLRARIGAGYGTPQATNLFITSAGVPGNNTDLKSQTVVGVDLGADLRLTGVTASLTLFDERFSNELVTQSAGANLQSFTFNAPRSQHRGVELAADWRPVPALRLSGSYLHNEQTYRRYAERLSAGAFSAVFDRAGNSLPGVPRDYGQVRLTYTQPEGPLEGLGGYIEWTGKAATWMDNANLIRAPGYSLVNLGAFYDPPEGMGLVSRLRFYVSVQNVADEVYVASAGNIADSISSTTGAHTTAAQLETVTGSIYAGPPRTVVAGMRARF